jgi:hypothetical protein
LKIFVAIPLYDGKLGVETVRCLLNEQALAIKAGDDFTVAFLSGDAGIAGARNQLATDFLASGFDRMVFLDSDITFELGTLIKLAHQPCDFVGGCYRYKNPTEAYPINWLDEKELWSNEHGLIEVATLPTGFLALSRKVFESFHERFPERAYDHMGHKSFCYFQLAFKNGNFYGEDIYFCREWREMGGKVFLDPETKLTHWGFNPTPHHGHIGHWLKNRDEVKAV